MRGTCPFCYPCVMARTAAAARSVTDLLAALDDGTDPDYLMFWGHQPPADGGVSKSCLSQWWPAPFTVAGLSYPTAEHYMMAGKATLFGDAGLAEQIRLSGHPRDAKALGRQVRGFDEERWAAARFGIVVAGSLAKFAQYPALRDFLLATGDQVLVEASAGDRVWGIGLPAADARSATPHTWQGLNLLGFALMEARHQLRPG
jgi:ribA/ribD-fused uncharacterized protein